MALAVALCVVARVPSAAEEEGKDPQREAEKRPPLERLIELNAGQIFGGEAKIKDDRLTITIKTEAQFGAAFSGPGLELPGSLKGAGREILKDTKDPIAVCQGDGLWESKFELMKDFTIQFDTSIPRVARGSQLNIFVNKTDTGLVGTSFFATAIVVENGKVKSRAATDVKEMLQTPERWLDRKKKNVPVELKFSGGTFSVEFDKKKTVSVDGADNVSRGKIHLQFKKVSFIISNLRITTKLDREWCEQQVKALEQGGTLKLREEKAEVAKKSTKEEVEARERRRRELEAEEDL